MFVVFHSEHLCCDEVSVLFSYEAVIEVLSVVKGRRGRVPCLCT